MLKLIGAKRFKEGLILIKFLKEIKENIEMAISGANHDFTEKKFQIPTRVSHEKNR